MLSETQKTARYVLTSIRTGTNKLRIETGRWKKPREDPRNRICRLCLSGEIEDERHFVQDCKAYIGLRIKLVEDIKRNTGNTLHLNLRTREETWQLLMNPQNNRAQILGPLKEFVKMPWPENLGLRTLHFNKPLSFFVIVVKLQINC